MGDETINEILASLENTTIEQQPQNQAITKTTIRRINASTSESKTDHDTDEETETDTSRDEQDENVQLNPTPQSKEMRKQKDIRTKNTPEHTTPKDARQQHQFPTPTQSSSAHGSTMKTRKSQREKAPEDFQHHREHFSTPRKGKQTSGRHLDGQRESTTRRTKNSENELYSDEDSDGTTTQNYSSTDVDLSLIHI